MGRHGVEEGSRVHKGLHSMGGNDEMGYSQEMNIYKYLIQSSKAARRTINEDKKDEDALKMNANQASHLWDHYTV